METEHFPLLPPDAQKDIRSRINKFMTYLEATKGDWWFPDLERYRAFLLAEDSFAQSTVAANIGSIKQQYRRLLDEGNLEQILSDIAPVGSDKAAFVAKALEAIEKATQPDTAYVHFTRTLQIEHLTHAQVEQLIGQIPVNTLMDIRDIIAIGLILCTGMSETELCELTVADIAVKGRTVTVHIPEVSGGKERMVQVQDTLFYDTPWIAHYIDLWFERTSIQEGYFLRGFYRGGNKYRDNKMSEDAVQRLLQSYSVPDEADEPKAFTALDLRRTFARRYFDSGASLEEIQTTLGQGSSVTTLQYVGLPERNTSNLHRGAGQAMIDRIRSHVV